MTIATAGRLMSDPVATSRPFTTLNGAEASAAGNPSSTPTISPTECSRLLKYADQPTATVAAANRYSSTRFQPMNQATSSPSVAYEYEYALPETGSIAANSA